MLVLSALLLSFILLRIYLHLSPGSNFDVAGYNIHHLFTGLLLIALGGMPLVLIAGNSRGLDVASVAFGAGLGMALDEWVYLIATDGSDGSYLLPVSLWDGILMVGLVLGYALVIVFVARNREKSDG